MKKTLNVDDALLKQAKVACGGSAVLLPELQPFFRNFGGNFPDSINHAVARVKGKTMVIHTPGDFSNAIDQIEKTK